MVKLYRWKGSFEKRKVRDMDAERSAQVIASEIPSIRLKLPQWRKELNLSPAATVSRAIALQLLDYADRATEQLIVVDPELGDAGWWRSRSHLAWSYPSTRDLVRATARPIVRTDTRRTLAHSA